MSLIVKETNQVLHTVRHSPTSVKNAFLERNYDAAMEGLAEAIKPSRQCVHCGRTGKAEPWALRAYLEAAGAVGAMSTVVVQIAQRLGARDENELQSLVESGRKLEGLGDMPILAQLEAALEVIKLCLGKEPEHAPLVAKVLASYAEVEE
jgi:hypothetical protein